MPASLGTFVRERRLELGLTQQAHWLTAQPGTEDAAVSSAQGRDTARNARVDRVLVVGHGRPTGYDLGECLPALPTVVGGG